MDAGGRRRAGRLASAIVLAMGLAAAGWLLVAGRGGRNEPSSIRPIIGPETAPGTPLLFAWEGGGPPTLHKEQLEFEHVHLAQRSYK